MSASLEAPDFTRLAPRAGSRVVVAGGCGGIGRRLVEACVQTGLKVTVLDLESSIRNHPVPAGVKAIAVNGTDDGDVVRAFGEVKAHWGAIDHLFFLIGFTLSPPVEIEKVTATQWEEIMAGNLRSAFLMTREAIPLLREAGGGSIVTVASGLGVNLLPGYGPYGSAKAGLIGLTKAIAAENAPLIRANAVAPSAILTAFMGGGTSRGGDDRNSWKWFEDGAEKYVPMIPLRRLAVPEDVVGPVLFLASDSARFMTGQVLHVNGGRITP